MALAISIISVEPVGMDLRVIFQAVASSSYSTGGDTLDFTSVTQNALFVGPVAAIPSSLPPKSIRVASAGGQIKYQYVPSIGSAQNNCLLLVTSAFNTQIAATTYPAEVTGDTIIGEAVFTKLI